MKKIVLVATTLLVRAWAGDAPAPQLNCDNPNHISGLITVCEMVEIPVAFSGSLSAATPAGGISVVGWDQPDMLVRAQIEASAPNQWEAAGLASAIHINASPSNVSPDGPAQAKWQNWTVTFEIFVPHTANLTLNAKFGGIAITDVQGTIRFSGDMGGVTLVRLAGDVQGSTHMGGISIVLSGDHWDGEGLAAQANMGGIEVSVPNPYSAHFSLSTGMGKIDASYLGAGTAPSKGFGGQLTFDAGSGGSTIALATKMGGIAFKGI